MRDERNARASLVVVALSVAALQSTSRCGGATDHARQPLTDSEIQQAVIDFQQNAEREDAREQLARLACAVLEGDAVRAPALSERPLTLLESAGLRASQNVWRLSQVEHAVVRAGALGILARRRDDRASVQLRALAGDLDARVRVHVVRGAVRETDDDARILQDALADSAPSVRAEALARLAGTSDQPPSIGIDRIRQVIATDDTLAVRVAAVRALSRFESAALGDLQRLAQGADADLARSARRAWISVDVSGVMARFGVSPSDDLGTLRVSLDYVRALLSALPRNAEAERGALIAWLVRRSEDAPSDARAEIAVLLSSVARSQTRSEETDSGESSLRDALVAWGERESNVHVLLTLSRAVEPAFGRRWLGHVLAGEEVAASARALAAGTLLDLGYGEDAQQELAVARRSTDPNVRGLALAALTRSGDVHAGVDGLRDRVAAVRLLVASACFDAARSTATLRRQ